MMKENNSIIAPHLSGEEKKVLYEKQSFERGKGLMHRSWETPPDKEIQIFEPLLWEMIAQEESFAGISSKEKSLERTHFLPKEKYTKMFGDSWGVYYKERDAIYMQEHFSLRGNISPERQRALRLRTLLHENIHTLSYEEDMVSKKTGKMYARRSGYLFSSSDGTITKFRGLNEAINEKICFEIFRDNEENLREIFPDSERRDWIFTSYAYPQESAVLEFLLFELAKKTNKSQEEVWIEYRKGISTGNIRHLKEVDRVYGPGSLRFLASMGSLEGDNITKESFSGDQKECDWIMQRNCFRNYFSSSGKNFEQRFLLVKDILSDKEKDRFKRENGYEGFI